jgi:uncharacterized membrane protein YheB (UPF0754 family)
MTAEMIEKFIENKNRKGTAVNIHFKERSTVTGLFINGLDYDELKAKNFWRIVSSTNADQWKQTKDMNLARIYNGLSFTRLSEDSNS